MSYQSKRELKRIGEDLSLAALSTVDQDTNQAKAIASTLDKDWQLVVRCQKGERQAQYELYQRYKDWVFNIAFRMANHQQDAEDITQIVFVRLFRKIDSFRGDSAFSSWLYRMTVNLCINHYRKEKRHKERISNDLSDAEKTHGATLHNSHRREERFNLRPHLEKAIRQLPEKYRMVFTLHDIEGYNHKEIGQMMNIADGTSKSQLHKARKELRRTLEPYMIMLNKI